MSYLILLHIRIIQVVLVVPREFVKCYKYPHMYIDEEKTIILLGLVADMVFTEIHDRCIHEKRMLLATVI